MKLNYDYEEKRPDYDKHEPHKCTCREPMKYDYYEHEKCCDEHKFAKCSPKNPCPYPIIFECATGTGAQIRQTAINNGGFTPRTIGCLTIDTTCLKMPVVKFDFCTRIEYRVFSSTPEPVRLTFQLCKTCDNGSEICCGNWDYEARFANNSERLTTSFCFSHCECNSCPGCCTYTVKIVDAVNIETDDILNVCDTTLSAIAKSAC